jgi:chromosome segregation ATPase
MQPGGGNSQWLENLEHLRAQLEEQVTALTQKKQQLRATLQDDVESASVQVKNQYHLLDNLRYEGEVLTEKLMKLRSSRQDIEAELFVLKDKRIRLLEDISKLEDEEMQLVSEVRTACMCLQCISVLSAN